MSDIEKTYLDSPQEFPDDDYDYSQHFVDESRLPQQYKLITVQANNLDAKLKDKLFTSELEVPCSELSEEERYVTNLLMNDEYDELDCSGSEVSDIIMSTVNYEKELGTDLVDLIWKKSRLRFDEPKKSSNSFDNFEEVDLEIESDSKVSDTNCKTVNKKLDGAASRSNAETGCFEFRQTSISGLTVENLRKLNEINANKDCPCSNNEKSLLNNFNDSSSYRCLSRNGDKNSFASFELKNNDYDMEDLNQFINELPTDKQKAVRIVTDKKITDESFNRTIEFISKYENKARNDASSFSKQAEPEVVLTKIQKDQQYKQACRGIRTLVQPRKGKSNISREKSEYVILDESAL